MTAEDGEQPRVVQAPAPPMYAPPVRIDPASMPAATRRLLSTQRPNVLGEARLYDPMPFPSKDGMPIDGPEIPLGLRFTARKWLVYCLLHQGLTSKQAAKEAGIGIDTVIKYRKQWRQRYGQGITSRSIQQVMVDPRYQKPESEAPEARAELVGSEYDAIALLTRRVAAKWLDQYAGPGAEERIAELSPSEVKAIQEIGVNAQKAALEARKAAAAAEGGAAPAAPRKGSSASQAMKGLTQPTVRKGQKGVAAEGAAGVVVELRGQLDKFRQAREALDA